MSYPPLADVRKTLRVDWYRCPIDRARLKELSKRSDLQGWLQAGGHVALFALTGTVAYLFWAQQNWLGFVVALFIHGTVGSFFVGTAPHELGHGTVFRTKWLNKAFLYGISLLSWWDPFNYAASHTYHHRYSLYPDGDRENVLPLDPSPRPALLLQLFTVNLFGRPARNFSKGGLFWTIWVTCLGAVGKHAPADAPITEWLEALHADQPAQHRRSIMWSRLLLAFHGTVLVVSVATGQWVLPLLLTFFPFIGNWGSYSLGLTQHCGLRDNVPDFRKNSRSMTLNPLAEFLYWRMNWHIEHHMYAGVPCYNLKNLAREVADDMPRPRTLAGAWREMWDAWRKQQSDPDYQFDTPLPPSAKSSRKDTPDALESSIGELAPEGLR